MQEQQMALEFLLKVLPDGFENCSDEQVEELYGRAYSYYQASQYAEAINVFRVLTAFRPREKRFWQGTASTLQQLGQWQEAAEAYAMAAIYDTEMCDPFPHFYAAQCFHSLGEIQKGLEVLKAAEYIAKPMAEYQGLMGQIALLKEAWKKQQKEKKNARY